MKPGFIAVVDSGVGGLGIWREVVRLLPGARTLYFADQAHVPYGGRSLDEVRAFAEAISAFLIGRGCSLVVLGSNTISAAALRPLRRLFPDTRFVGMEPAVKPAAERTRRGVVGVMATKATFQGELFNDLAARFAPGVRIVAQACPGLVEAVEAGDLDSPRTARLVRRYLAPILDAGADQLVLGCTHYPFLRPIIERTAAGRLQLIDPAAAVAEQVWRIAREAGQASGARGGAGARRPAAGESRLFLTTGRAAELRRMIRRLLPEQPGKGLRVEKACWKGGRLEVRIPRARRG